MGLANCNAVLLLLLTWLFRASVCLSGNALDFSLVGRPLFGDLMADFYESYQLYFSIMLMVVGLLQVFLGYRSLKVRPSSSPLQITLFFIGFLIGGFGGFVGCDFALAKVIEARGLSFLCLGVLLVIGTLVGILFVVVSEVGFFLVNLVLGFVFGCLLGTLIIMIGSIHTVPLILILSMGGATGLAMAILQYFFRKITIVNLSAAGALAVIAGIGGFAHNFPSLGSIIDYASHGMKYPKVWWFYYAGIGGLMLVGMVVQIASLLCSRKTMRSEIEQPLITYDDEEELNRMRKEAMKRRLDRSPTSPSSS